SRTSLPHRSWKTGSPDPETESPPMPGIPGDSRLLFERIERRLRDSSSELLTFLPARIHLSGPRLGEEIRRLADTLGRAGLVAGSRVLLATSHPLVVVLTVP